MYDLIIIGGGPGGVAAGVYAARKKMKTALVAGDFGGQSAVSAAIGNWIGVKSISGAALAKMLEEHLRAQEDVDILVPELVDEISPLADGFKVSAKSGKVLETKTILIATGGSRRKLGIPGEAKLEGKGVSYCSTCDAPIFKNKTVAVVGGGNAGLETAGGLLPYANKIYVLEFADNLTADRVLQEEIAKNKKIEIIALAKAIEILGDKFVSGLKYEDRQSGETKELKLEGVFVEIGTVPNTGFVKGLVKINERGEITIDHKTQRTSRPGIWAAGDATDALYRQNNIAAGDAIKAVLNIHNYLLENSRG